MLRKPFVWAMIIGMALYPSFDSPSVSGGILDDFEKDATIPRRSNHHGHDDDHWVWDLFFEGLLGSLFEPDYQDTHGQRLPELENIPGDGLRPWVRFDFGYQNVESDVDAQDYRLEVGFDHFALQWRRTQYEETNPLDDLDMDQGHVLFRFYDDAFEINFGLGYASLSGNSTHSGMSLTVPVLFHLNKFIGFELRPAWSFIGRNQVSDYDLVLSLGWDYAVCHLGYRWVKSDHESLDGPYAGFSIRF